MTLQFEFDIEDWMEFQKHFISHSKRIKRTKWIITLLPPGIMAIVYLSDLSTRDSSGIGLIVLVLMMGLLDLVLPQEV